MPEIHATIAPPDTTKSVESPIDSGLRGPMENNIETPFSQFQSSNDMPYTAKFFEVGDWQKFGPEVALIEDYVSAYINDNGFNDSLASYSEIISGILTRMGVSNNESPLNKILKISKYIEMTGRVKTAERQLEEMLNRSKV